MTRDEVIRKLMAGWPPELLSSLRDNLELAYKAGLEAGRQAEREAVVWWLEQMKRYERHDFCEPIRAGKHLGVTK